MDRLQLARSDEFPHSGRPTSEDVSNLAVTKQAFGSCFACFRSYGLGHGYTSRGAPPSVALWLTWTFPPRRPRKWLDLWRRALTYNLRAVYVSDQRSRKPASDAEARRGLTTFRREKTPFLTPWSANVRELRRLGPGAI